MSPMSLEKRARDVDRQLGVDALQSALAQGQLKQVEYEERAARVLVASTLADIDRELADLQVDRGPRVSAPGYGAGTTVHVVRHQNWSELPTGMKIVMGAVLAAAAAIFLVVVISLVTDSPPGEWFGGDDDGWSDVTYEEQGPGGL